MNPVSKNIMQFIKGNFGVQKNTPIFTSKSVAFLKTIYKDILKSERNWIDDGNASIHRSLPGHIQGNHFADDSEYTYIPSDIRLIIEHGTNWIMKYKFILNGDNYMISMIHPCNITETNVLRFFEDALHKIYLWLSVVNRFAPKHCSQYMHIHLFFTEHMKTLAKTEMEPLDRIHANSAFTTGCAISTNIHIFRKEEWFKVFIHETFHNLGLDFSKMDQRLIDQNIIRLFPIAATEIRLYETYCEIWAEVINLLFFVFFTTQDTVLSNFDRILRKMERLLHYEIVFSRFQCAKILNHYKITYGQLTDPASKQLLETRYKENTQILAYYIIKFVLLSEPDQFIKWCLRHDGPTLEFKKTQDNVQDFGKLVRQFYKTPAFLDKLQKMEEWFSKNLKKNTFEFNTFRMTLFG